MSPIVRVEQDYHITLTETLVFPINDFLIMRTDEAEDQDNQDEDGYCYFIFSNGTYLSITPEDAQSIVQQIFDYTGEYVCDY
jgi:hypothetical protein